jgi:queuine tRNA-ribosyltransferase
MPNFKVDRSDTKSYARTGLLELKHGTVKTPVFMPVGTYGAVRGISSLELDGLGSEIMLSNTYHLFSRAGAELIEKMGGLHKFISWNRPLLTDSGGFQVFSLADQRKITEDGVTFKNKINGDRLELTPEKVIALQETFGSDVMMVLDECPPPTASAEDVFLAVKRTTRWAERSRHARTKKDLALFPIIQGGAHDELRELSTKEILRLEVGQDPWEGIAIGGLSVGEVKEKFVQTLYSMRNKLPTDRPRYLMGVGTPRDLVFAVGCGIDMFDCVLPSRNGRHGIVMTTKGRLNLFNAKNVGDVDPIDTDCACHVCKTYSRGFLRHLFRVEDTLAGRLCTLHNIAYFLQLMKTIQSHIESGTFLEFSLQFLKKSEYTFLGGEKGFDQYPERFV